MTGPPFPFLDRTGLSLSAGEDGGQGDGDYYQQPNHAEIEQHGESLSLGEQASVPITYGGARS